MAMIETRRRYLTDEQIASYRRDGYLAIPRLIEVDQVRALRQLTERFVDRARTVARSDGVFDLDPRHTADTPGAASDQKPGGS